METIPEIVTPIFTSGSKSSLENLVKVSVASDLSCQLQNETKTTSAKNLQSQNNSGNYGTSLAQSQNPFYLNNYIFPLPSVNQLTSENQLTSVSQSSGMGYNSYYGSKTILPLGAYPSSPDFQIENSNLVTIAGGDCICSHTNVSHRFPTPSPNGLFSTNVYLLKKMMPPSVTSIGVLWTLISVVLAFLSAFSIAASTWVLQFSDSDQNGFGPMKSCQLTVENNLFFLQKCSYFVLDNGVMNWPSSPFQVTALLYSVGTLFLMVAAGFAAASLVTLSVWRQRMSWFAGYFQLSAVLVQTFALAIFPMGFHSAFVQNMCGVESSMYNMGHCHLGWGYVLAIVTTSLVVFCPFLSKFSSRSSKRNCPAKHNQRHAEHNITNSARVPVRVSTECV